jgi:hypothetical protein
MAPRTAPLGRKWCAKHNEGRGEFLAVEDFPSERYSYCTDCKREYQRKWESENREARDRAPYTPTARLSKSKKKIIVHVPNDEKGRNHVRVLLNYYSDGDVQF